MKKHIHVILGFVIVALLFFPFENCYASKVILKNGNRLEGKIINWNDEFIVLEMYGGKARTKIELDKIERIQEVGAKEHIKNKALPERLQKIFGAQSKQINILKKTFVEPDFGFSMEINGDYERQEDVHINEKNKVMMYVAPGRYDISINLKTEDTNLKAEKKKQFLKKTDLLSFFKKDDKLKVKEKVNLDNCEGYHYSFDFNKPGNVVEIYFLFSRDDNNKMATLSFHLPFEGTLKKKPNIDEIIKTVRFF